MKNKFCEACKSIGKYNSGHHMDVIFHESGAPSHIRLCYHHSVELFKTGQTNFIGKYRPEMPGKDVPTKDAYDPLQNYFTFSSFR